MKQHTAEEVMNMFDSTSVFKKNEYTYVEYVDNLLLFQKTAAELVIGGDNTEHIRLNEVLARFESIARERNLYKDKRVSEGLKALNIVSKSLAVSMAGKRGEDRVANTFTFVSRPDASFYRNIYLSNEKNETEFDALVVTQNGILILEVKNAKEDITIAPDGRLLFNNSTCYHDISIGDKMATKRAILNDKLSYEFKHAGIDKKVVIDSLIVFSNPNGVRINVHDLFRQESYCFRGGLCRRIENFTSDEEYSEEELAKINEIFRKMEMNQKGFVPEVDPQYIKECFASAYEVLSNVPNQPDTMHGNKKRNKGKVVKWHKPLPKLAVAASFLTIAATTFGTVYRSFR